MYSYRMPSYSSGRRILALLSVLFMLASPLAASLLAVRPANAQEPTLRAAPGQKVELYKLLAYNNRININEDEIRLDFVLRVPRGSVDPACGGSVAPGGKAVNRTTNNACGGLTFLYSYYGGHEGAKYWYRVMYLRTLDQSSIANGSSGAQQWAKNRDQFYTIHNVVHSGSSDYLTISLEADVAYVYNAPDTGIKKPDSSQAGGVYFPQYIYAFIGQDSGYWLDTPAAAREPGAIYGDTYFLGSDSQFSDSGVNIGEGAPVQLYTDAVSGGQSNGPISFIGWDGYPQLWSLNQANWGLVTDYGLDVSYNYANGSPLNQHFDEGVAPPRSFFVFFSSPGYDKTYYDAGTYKPYPCSTTTSFYYQWVGLKDGTQWVPVSQLTPTDQQSSGQTPSSIDLPSYLGPTSLADTPAYNAPTNGAHTPNNLLASGAAQRSDGSIDFKLAKDTDGLDGYFKLVAWPISTNADGSTTGCQADPIKQAFNPDHGIDASMSQEQIDARIARGWTVDTAYYKFELPKPDPPTIDQQWTQAYSPTLKPTITGRAPAVKGEMGVHGYDIELYREDELHPGSAILVGSQHVAASAVWSISDTNADGHNVEADDPADPAHPRKGHTRYWAQVIEHDTGTNLISEASNSADVTFYIVPDTAPHIQAVNVPHTVLGALPTGSVVRISGVATVRHPHSQLNIYASSPAAADQSIVLATLEYTGPAQGSWTWSIDLAPSKFLPQEVVDSNWLFRAVIINPAQVASPPGQMSQQVDMTPAQAADVRADHRGVLGTALNGLPGAAGGHESDVAIRIKWPDGTTTDYAQGYHSQSSGSWHVPLPRDDMPNGTALVTLKDSAGNESAELPYDFRQNPHIRVLPTTGGNDVPLFLVSCGLLAALGSTACLLTFTHKRRGPANLQMRP
ncbi:hypothetical protein KIM372_14980 [Bombiscardovia nodaiensis]|uniref:Uncharacterized protein n=1 Tax=Bombiscardovia nodaiensis TaxID=2932181 RepID=A0ABM8BA09_9BIFI|nr:hypothetical protein KIM372_14980 [Bombiscardovia nodaiensis]